MKTILLVCLLCCVICSCKRYAATKGGNEQFNARYAGEMNDRVTGAVCYKGCLYVYGNFEGKLKKINLSSGQTTTLPCDFIASPHGLTVDSDNIWITDIQKHQIFKLDLEGNVLAEFGKKYISGCDKELFNAPTKVALAPNGNIYVTDGYGNRRVVCLDSTGRYLFEWGTEGGKNGEFVNPHDIVIFEDRIYIADRENCRVQIFAMDGRFLDQWPQQGKVFGLWYDSGKMYMTIQGQDSDFIAISDMDGKVTKKIGNRGKASGEFDVPHALTVDKKHIYIAEVANKRIQRIDISK